MRSYLKQETYMEYLEWQLYHSGVKLSKIEGEIEEFFVSSEILSRKSLLIGSFYKTDYWSPRWKVQKLKEINFRFGELLRGCVGNEAFSLKLWNELYIYWLGTRSDLFKQVIKDLVLSWHLELNFQLYKESEVEDIFFTDWSPLLLPQLKFWKHIVESDPDCDLD